MKINKMKKIIKKSKKKKNVSSFFFALRRADLADLLTAVSAFNSQGGEGEQV